MNILKCDALDRQKCAKCQVEVEGRHNFRLFFQIIGGFLWNPEKNAFIDVKLSETSPTLWSEKKFETCAGKKIAQTINPRRSLAEASGVGRRKMMDAFLQLHVTSPEY